jgi:hypothetical protein
MLIARYQRPAGSTRYPDPDTVSPTNAEVGEALEAVASLITAIVALAPSAVRADRDDGRAEANSAGC